MATISILLPCRLGPNRTSQFKRYLQSLSEACDDLKNIELLIKFDDDQDLTEALEIINEYKNIIDIKYIITSRGNGYQDLPLFYMDLLFKANLSYQIATVHSIDLVFNKKGFDTIFIDSIKKYKDGIFVIHSCITPSFKSKITTINDAVQWVDGFPAWSRKWLEIQGRFGHNASTDGWTQLTEFLLSNEFGIDRRIDISHYNFFSEIDNVDRSVTSEYWKVKRRESVEHHLSKLNIDLARQNAKNIMLNIINHECLELQQSNKESIDVYNTYLINSTLNAYDNALIAEQNFNIQQQKFANIIAEKELTISHYQKLLSNSNYFSNNNKSNSVQKGKLKKMKNILHNSIKKILNKII